MPSCMPLCKCKASHIYTRPHVCSCINVRPRVFMQGLVYALMYACGGDTWTLFLAPWGLGLKLQVVRQLDRRSCTMGCGVESVGGEDTWTGGLVLNSGKVQIVWNMEYLVICDLTFKEVTSMLHCNGTNTVMVKTWGLMLNPGKV